MAVDAVTFKDVAALLMCGIGVIGFLVLFMVSLEAMNPWRADD